MTHRRGHGNHELLTENEGMPNHWVIGVLILATIGCGGGGDGANGRSGGAGDAGPIDEGDYCTLVVSAELRDELRLGPGQRAHLLLLQRDMRRGMRIEKRGMANPSWEYVLNKAERSRLRLGGEAKALLSVEQATRFEEFYGSGKVGDVEIVKTANGFVYGYRAFGTGEPAEYSRSSKHVGDDLVRAEFRSVDEGLAALEYPNEDVRVLAATFVRDADRTDVDSTKVVAALEAAFATETGRAKGHIRDAIGEWRAE